MLNKVVIWLVVSILCGILYRMGGAKGFNTKFRDFGGPLITYGYLLTLWQPLDLQGWFMLFITFGLTFGALTTYWDSIFGYDNFYAHGFGIGIACLPLLWAGIPLWFILTRTLVLALFMGLWCKFWGWDLVEEIGRGAIISATIPFLLI